MKHAPLTFSGILCCGFLFLVQAATAQNPAPTDPCSTVAPELEAVGSRYLEVGLTQCIGDFAIQILGQGFVRCVELYVQPDGRLGPVPYFQDSGEWGSTVVARGAEIIPAATYKARFEDPGGVLGPDSPEATTWRYGKTDGASPFAPNLMDLVCVLDTAAGSQPAPPCTLLGADLTGAGCCIPDRRVDQSDVDTVVDAASGHPFPCPGPCCLIIEDFEGGYHGWTNSAESTCTTGDFVHGTPTEMSIDGHRTQVGSDHTAGTGKALFTAFNTSPGNADVDGGECILESPEYAIHTESDVSLWYYHGQRDPGDDPSGDFFHLEFSIDGSTDWSSMASFGDERIQAEWTEAIATGVSAGSRLKIRLRVSDGAGPGDIIEAGLDDLVICPSN